MKLFIIILLFVSPIANAFTINYNSYNPDVIDNGIAKTLDNNFEVGTKFRPIKSNTVCTITRVWVGSGFSDESLIFFRANCPRGSMEGLLNSIF
ncbi:hypothetical protein [Photobacterium leiognathi]|uniref:hypothetical protein n=1 Tax=Photobacterium leiognathi TaxID=553611 RepID=UPI000D16B695|nr:hypothetical protein [Photobacterium leiognathi]PSW42634.1 hypothetical protein C0W40_15325 [Photobacterium leiognathi subsp. mandapamensis]